MNVLVYWHLQDRIIDLSTQVQSLMNGIWKYTQLRLWRRWRHILLFYVYGSVHLWSILIIVQRDAIESRLFIVLQVQSTCFWCQPHPSSGVHKTVTTASSTGHIFCAPSSLQRGQASCTKNMISTGGCSYSFVYSWWWVWLTPETGRVNLQNCFVLHLVGQLLI